MIKKVSIVWKDGKHEGKIWVKNGKLLKISSKDATIDANGFSFIDEKENRLELEIESENKVCIHGAVVNVFTQENPFSFFVEHVNKEYPIYIPEYRVIVTEISDKRTYNQIEGEILSKQKLSKLKQIEASPEETYEEAARNTRSLRGHIWLGISRDIRIFEVVFPDPDRTTIQIFPKLHGQYLKISELESLDEISKKRYGEQVFYQINLGRGCGCSLELKRELEEGYLPILNGRIQDEDIIYRFQMFTTLERTKLTLKNLRGTHFLVADGYGAGHMFTEKQQAEFDSLVEEETNRKEETVLFLKIEAINIKDTPAYAFFAIPKPNIPYKFENGLTYFSKDRIFGITMLDGRPVKHEEFSVFLLPGQKAEIEIRIPHKPISLIRAKNLMKQAFEVRKKECKRFWQSKIEKAARIELPEKRIEDMIKAGLLHLDLVAYGIEPDCPVAACIGVYCPIGSESSPIIQFFDTMGWHSLARRSLQYFIEKQHEDGFMQNFGGYMLETGAALWSMGEHFRYTKDTEWVKSIKPSILKAVEYISRWIERNKKDQFKGKGYGMIDGKVGDPEDPYRYFMLNGYAYLGLQRVSEMLEAIRDDFAKEVRKMAEQLKENTRESFFCSMSRSPVVPLGDGRWVPTAPPWPEDDGLLVQYVNGGKWFTHGTFLTRDSLVGPLYLIFQEILSPQEQAADFLIRYHTEMFYKRNVAFSQPYYSRHPEIHLKRGEIHSFLKAYYNCFPALIDRQTKTFWEHFFYASPHKTHEEAWFLMETRWMLCMEQDETLLLLPGTPRRWLEDGSLIRIENLATYFGKISFSIFSNIKNKKIIAKISCQNTPERIILRVPHPEKLLPKRITGSRCKIEDERLVFENPSSEILVTLYY